jgi:hypothetical protein
MSFRLIKNDSGVSPVIGVVLIIALLVSLVSLVTFVAFDISNSSNTEESVDASFQLSKNGDNVRAIVYRNENVKSFILENGSDKKVFGPSVGSISKMPIEEGSYVLKAIPKNGETEQVLDTLTIDESEVESNVISGSVQINPAVQGAEVKLYNNNTGSLVSTKLTDSNGEYEFSVDPNKNYDIQINVTDNQITINGDTKRMYAGGWENSINPGQNINFDFGNELTVNCQIDSNDAIVGFQKGQNSKYKISNPMQTHCIDDAGIDGQYILGDNVKDTTGDGLSDYRQEKVLNIDPSVNDTDSDGLKDKRELQFGTDPNLADTSRDGFNDSLVYEKPYLENSKKNILVEVSYMDNQTIDINSVEFQEIKEKFESEGYNIEFDVDSSPVPYKQDIKLYNGYLNDYYKNSSIYTQRSDGYLHLLIVESLGDGSDSSNLAGITSGDPNFLDGMMVKYFDETNKTEHFIMHEIGHQIGLVGTGITDTNDDIVANTDRKDGIDSTSISCGNYSSVMNYNCQPNEVDYLSLGFSSDDWSIIGDYKNQTNPINTEQLCVDTYNCSA